MSTDNLHPRRVTYIRATTERGSLIREVFEARELLMMLAWRDVKVRYKQSLVGIGWAVMQPLLTTVVLHIFSRLLGMRQGAVPYPLLALSGLVPWVFLVHALTLCSGSLVNHQALLTKIYFPRIIVPLATVLGGSVDILISVALLPVFLLYYGVGITPALLALPLYLAMLFGVAFAAGLWLAVLNVRYRDVTNALPFVMQLWFFLTPVAFSTELIPKRYWFLAGLNPMTGMVEGFRWTLFGKAHPALGTWTATGCVIILLLMITGIQFFLRREQEFSDIL